MTTVILCSTSSSSSSSSLLRRINHRTTVSLHRHLPATVHPPPPNLTVSRRNTALSLSIAALFPFLLSASPAAFAFDFDFRISGPKDWLKERKKKSIKYLLAPIVASREILNYAQQLLSSKDSRFEEKDMEEFRGMLNTAARDCVVADRNSLVAFQAKTGVEVCTFKLVVSNASSLLNDDDPTKLEAEARLDDLIRSFAFLNGLVKEDDVVLVANRSQPITSAISRQNRSLETVETRLKAACFCFDVLLECDRQKVVDAVTDTLSTLDKFEQGIKGCIEA